MLTKTMLHNGIEDAKRAIRQNLESNQFAEVLITVNAWVGLKKIEDTLKSGSVETKEVEKDFDLSYSLCQPIYNPDKRLEDMDVTITDTSDELDKARALIKKYVLEDKRKQATVIAVRAYQIALEGTTFRLKVENEINSLYHKEFGEPSPAIMELEIEAEYDGSQWYIDTDNEENKTITGGVTMLEGAWVIMNDCEQLASVLWSETAENEIIGNIYENKELLEEEDK